MSQVWENVVSRDEIEEILDTTMTDSEWQDIQDRLDDAIAGVLATVVL